MLCAVAAFVGMSLVPASTAAQSSPATTTLRHVIEMRVQVAHAPIYTAPRRNAEVVHTLAWNEPLLALAQTGAFYRVVQPEGGHQGYVLSTHLHPTEHPLGGADMPDAVRRAQRFVGARLDIQASLAVPVASSDGGEAFRAAVGAGMRLAYPVAGPVGLTARVAYQQFGPAERAVTARGVRPLDWRQRDLTVMAGALGMELAAFRGRRIALAAIVDAGAYHVGVDDRIAPAQNPFGRATTLTWGGSASVQLSIRLGGAVRLFAESGYEVIRASGSDVHLWPARGGVSLER